MKYDHGIYRDMDLFLQGASSMTQEGQKIREAMISYFGKKYKNTIDYLLSLRTTCYSEKQMAGLLNKRDSIDGFFESELKAAARNGLVIAMTDPDDRLELHGAIRAEGSCYKGRCFHITRTGDIWQLIPLSGKSNNIAVIWESEHARTEDGGIISWSCETDIPGAEPFIVTFDGNPYCRGLVFSVKHLDGNLIA